MILDTKYDFENEFYRMVLQECGRWTRSGNSYYVELRDFKNLGIKFVDTNIDDGCWVNSGFLNARVFLPYSDEEKKQKHIQKVQENYGILDEAQRRIYERFSQVALTAEMNFNY
jgi:hypothetical protein